MISTFKYNIKKHLILLARRFVNVDKNTVLMSGFYGEYSDNPKYIAEKLHEINPNINIYWVIGNSKESFDTSEIPEWINIVYSNTLEYLILANKAAVLFGNYWGFFLNENPTELDYKLKNEKQLNISTGHGTPLKKIGFDIEETNKEGKIFSSSDMFVVGNNWTKERMYSSYAAHYQKPIEIKVIGSPRNDILFKDYSTEQIEHLKTRLGIPKEKNVLLYAPTFRKNDVMNSGINQIKELDIGNLLKAMRKIKEGEWVFVFRAHHEVAGNPEIAKRIQDNNLIIDGNKYRDMQEYLKVSDCLLTDYSSSMFDYVLTKKPCFLFALDYTNYITGIPGAYNDPKSLLFPFSESNDELIKNIENFDSTSYSFLAEQVLVEIGNADKGTASKTTCDIILSWMDKVTEKR